MQKLLTQWLNRANPKGILLPILLLLLTVQVSFATRYYVTTTGSSSNNGTAWATPKDLQSALSVALAGDEIWVAVGTYYPTTGTDRDISFIINKNIQLYGGFAGMEGSLAARVAGNVTILSGDIGTPNDNSDNTKTIVNIDGTTANGNITASCILDGFTIRDGKAFAGAGCNLSGNGNGKVCSPMISNCVFANNAASYGGAITNNGNSGTSSPMISNCVFANNTASYGGAIYNNGVGGTSSPMISNCVFANNTASYGGAISNNGNSSTSSPTITNCTFYNNTATVNGQAIHGDYNSSNTDISRTTTLTNCIIWQNSSYTGNNALAESYGKFTLKNTIVQNLGANQTAFALGTPTNCSEADPLFMSTTNLIGADNIWGTADDGLQLQSTSPAINAGDPSVSSPTTDITGFTRTGTFDTGAYEYRNPCSAPSVQASNLVFTDLTSTSCKILFDNGDGSNNLVVIKEGGAIDPNTVTDLATYTADGNFTSMTSSTIDGGKVVDVDNGNAATITGLSANKIYYVSVFSFNSCGKYLKTTPASGYYNTFPQTPIFSNNDYQYITGYPGTNTGSVGNAGWSNSESPRQVIDGDANTKYLNFKVIDNSVKAGFDVNAQQFSNVTRIGITTANDDFNRDVRDFTLSGSVDSSTWRVVLNGTIPYDGTRLQTRYIDFWARGIFKYYRFVVNASNNAAAANNIVQIADVQLYGDLICNETTPVDGVSSNTQDVTANNYFTDASCRSVGRITPAGSSPVSGNVTYKTWRENDPISHGGKLLVHRHFEITPAANAATSTGRVTLYFQQGDFDAFNALSTTDLPTGTSDAAGKANLKVLKYAGSGDASGLPASYSGARTIIDPVDADIIWNAAAYRWEVSFDVTGFSGFFLGTDVVLPLELLSFSGKNTEGGNLLTWTTANEKNNVGFDIEWLTGNGEWHTLGFIKGNNYGSTYLFTDDYRRRDAINRVSTTTTAANYYRLRQIDNDSKAFLSKVIAIQAKGSSKLKIYPNPTKDDQMTLEISENTEGVTISNAIGQLFFQQETKGENRLRVDISTWASGVYFIKSGNDIVKFIKN